MLIDYIEGDVRGYDASPWYLRDRCKATGARPVVVRARRAS